MTPVFADLSHQIIGIAGRAIERPFDAWVRKAPRNVKKRLIAPVNGCLLAVDGWE